MTTTIFGTSNNRVACTVNSILELSGLELPGNWVYDNGCVIKLEGLGATSRLTMIHPENVSNPDRFVSKQTFNEKFKDELPIAITLGNTTYLVRHGHAGHNEFCATNDQAHDASLTSTGIIQAKNSGLAILNDSRGILPNLKVKCSDLFRTMQTIEYVLLELPEEQRPNTCEVCIEARENSRPIGGLQHWKKDDPLTEIAIDPTISLEQLRLLAPGKTDVELERMGIENRPKNDPIKNWNECLKKVNWLNIDWSKYIEKLTKGYAEGKTFGQIASQKTLLEIIIEE